MRTNGARLLVDCLLAQGTTTAFRVPGESYLAVLDALYDVGDRIRMVPNRQEGGAAFMAAAWGKLTGQPIADASYRDDLLYRHFVYVEPDGEGPTLTGFELLGGNPDRVFKDGVQPERVLAAALGSVWENIGRVPVLFDPFYALGAAIDSFDASDGWLNVYERYEMAV